MFHKEVTAVLHDFSRSDNSSEWEVSENELEYVQTVFDTDSAKLLFYANGNCERNKGYVSIILHKIFRVGGVQHGNLEEAEVRYFFSVVDVSGNKRFTQSIVYSPGKAAASENTKDSRGYFHFGLERYLNREILLNDPAELLPDDCLTIFVDIDYIPLSSDQNLDYLHQMLKSSYCDDSYNFKIIHDCMTEFSFSIDDECGRLCIPLDTFYGRRLCSLSGFFQRASDTPLTEGTVRNVHIPNEELVAFRNIFNILFKSTMDLGVESIEDICQMYIIADKYDFQSMTQTCRQLIKAFLRTADDSEVWEHANQRVPDIIELANKYGDSDLKDTVKTFLESKESFGMKNNAIGEYLKENIFSDWQCVSRQIGCQFKFSRITKPEFESYL